MATAVELALAAVTQSLTGMPGVLSVERDRADPAHADEMPCISVSRGDTEHSAYAAGLDVVLAGADLEIYVAGTDCGTQADALHQAAHQRLVADTTLASLVRELRCVSTQWSPERRDVLTGRLTCRYQLRLALRASSLAKAS